MADNVSVSAGSYTATIATDEVIDGTLGTVEVQFVKLMDGTLDSTNKLVVDSSGRASVAATGAAASGAAVAGNPLLIGGTDGTNARSIKVDTAGNQYVAPAPPPTATTGNITTAATTIGPVTMGEYDGLTVVVSGTYAGVNFGFWGSNDNSLWFPVAAVRSDTGIVETTTGVLTANTTRAWDISIGESLYFRIVSTAFTSGSAAINIMPGMFASESMVGAICQGAVAAGSAIAGNPVLAGGTDGTNARTLLTSTSGVLDVQVTGATGTGLLPTAAASADALANPTVTQIGSAGLVFNGTTWDRTRTANADAQAVTGILGSGGMVYNGATWDRIRGMSGALTTGDTGAKTATGNGATVTNVGNKGVQIFIVLGAVTGTTPTCTFKVQGSVDGGTNWFDINGATTASLTATANVGITIYPGIAVTAGTTTTGTTAAASAVLPRTWRMVWTIGGTTPSFTITSITYNYIPN
jgi:hypothetical protein